MERTLHKRAIDSLKYLSNAQANIALLQTMRNKNSCFICGDLDNVAFYEYLGREDLIMQFCKDCARLRQKSGEKTKIISVLNDL